MIAALTALGLLTLFLIWRSPRRRQTRKLRKLPGFKVSTVYAGGRGKRGLAISSEMSQFAVTNKWRRPSIHEFSEIVAVEVLRNGDAITTTDRGSQVAGAAVGALLLGPIGLLVGGLSGRRKQTQKVSSLVLRIVTSDMKAPVVDVPFFETKAPGLDANSKRLQRTAMLVAEWHGRFLSAMRDAGPTVQGKEPKKMAPHSPQG